MGQVGLGLGNESHDVYHASFINLQFCLAKVDILVTFSFLDKSTLSSYERFSLSIKFR